MRSLSSAKPRIPTSEADNRYQSLIEKQNSQLSQLRSQLQSLRTQYNDFKREYQSQSLQLQRQLYSVQRRRDLLTRRLQELRDTEKSRTHERMADEMIEQIWSILTAHRKPSSPHPSEPRLPPSFDLDSDQEIVPIIPETPTLYDDPTLTETPKPFESIATRRTRRSGAGNVYYKEPSLRTALSPGDPYTFSVEDGIVTPTIPTGYNRKTPVVDQRSRRMTGRK